MVSLSFSSRPAHATRVDGRGAEQDGHEKDDNKGMYLMCLGAVRATHRWTLSASINGGGILTTTTFEHS